MQVIQEIQHSHTNGIVIVLVVVRLQTQQTQHIQQQHKKTQQVRHTHIKQKMQMEHGQIVQRQKRHGIMCCQQWIA